MTLAELREKRKALAAKMEERYKLFHEQGGEWKDDEQRATWEAINTDYNNVMEEIDREEARAAARSQVDERMEEIRRWSAGGNDNAGQFFQTGDDRRMRDDQPVTEETQALALTAWCRAQLGEHLEQRHTEAAQRMGVNPNAKYLDIPLYSTRQAQMIRHRFNSMRPEDRAKLMWAEARDLGIVTATKGQETVSEMFIRSLELNMLAFGGVRQAADLMITGTGEPMHWPYADDTSNEGELLGENTTIGNSVDPTFGDLTWSAYKFSSKPVLVGYELLEDSFINLPVVLGELLGERLGRITAKRHTTGTGTNQPRGIVTDSVLGVTAAGQAAITYNEVVQLEHSVDPAYRNGAAYMFNDSTLLLLRLLKDNDGYPLFQNGANSGVPDRINGRPFYISQEMASAAAGAISMLFGQLSKHKIRRVNGIRVYRMQERYRDTDQDGFVAFVREDSRTLKTGTAPIKHLIQAPAGP